MTYPNRLGDVCETFDRTIADISVIFHHILEHILLRFEYLLTDLNQWWLEKPCLRVYADAVASRGAPLKNCFGFIDGKSKNFAKSCFGTVAGTLRPICRPRTYQKECYNGHKRVHGLKFQSVSLPNGLIANLYGPVEGRRHDSFMLSESGLLQKLEDKNQGEAVPFYLYGDPAYPLRPELMAPFKGSSLSNEQKTFNKKMSDVRASVEWSFGKIVTHFAYLDFKKNLRLYVQPVSKFYKAGALLTNIHTCLYGSTTSSYFNLSPPTIDEYLVPMQ